MDSRAIGALGRLPRPWSPWAAIESRPTRLVLGLCAFELSYACAYYFGMSFDPVLAAPFWFPDAVLLCGLLSVGPRWWWLLLVAILPVRLLVAVPPNLELWFLAVVYVNDCAKGVIAALLLKRFLDDPIRLRSMRDLGLYFLFVVVLVPALSALGGAAAHVGLGREFWPSFEQWLLGDALASLVVAPILFYWVVRPPNPATFSLPRVLEAAALAIGLLVTLRIAFEPAADARDIAETRFYAPVPFMVWAAIRFRMYGATAVAASLSVFAVDAAMDGTGSFANIDSREMSSRLQHFLLLRIAPLYLAAVLIEQWHHVNNSLRDSEAALRRSEARYRDVVENQANFVCRLLPDGTLTFVNSTYCRFLGRERLDLLGGDFVELLPPTARTVARQALVRALAGTEQAAWECEVAHADGARGWHSWVCHALEAAADEAREIQVIGYDVTDRRRAEESGRQLAQATRFAAVGELTAMVAHEINQPLCAILSNAEAAEIMLRADAPPLDELREIVADIRKDDLRADAAIRGIRSLLRRRDYQPQPVDLQATVRHVFKLIAGDALHRRVPIRHELAADLPLVTGDRSSIEQVLVILIVNGMDAMKDTPEAARELVVTARRDDEFVRVTVRDRGHGIAAANMTQLFDSFFTTKADGMGMGLSIARSMIFAHGGRIWAENAADGGAAFHFTLALAPASTT